MCQWILKPNGQIVPRRIYRSLHTVEIYVSREKKKFEIFNKLIYKKKRYSINPSKKNIKIEDFYEYEDNENKSQITQNIKESVDTSGKALNLNPLYNTLISTVIQLKNNNKQ